MSKSKKEEVIIDIELSDTKQCSRNTRLKKGKTGKLSEIEEEIKKETRKKSNDNEINENAVKKETKKTENKKETQEKAEEKGSVVDAAEKKKLKREEIEKKQKDLSFVYDDGKTYFNNTRYKLSLKPSKIRNAGLGVFAEEAIPKGKIGNYDGKIIQRDKKKFDPDYSMEINAKYIIDGSFYPRPLTSMINDIYKTKKKHNCEFIVRESKKKVEVYAIKPIAEGDELYIDYGEEYWTSRIPT